MKSSTIKSIAIGTTKKSKNSDLTEENSGGVRALERGIHIIKCFDLNHPSWSIADLSRSVGLHNATTRRLVKTLESDSILTMDPVTGEYRLGTALLPLSYLIHSQNQLVRIAQPFLQRLVEQTSETVGFSVWTDRGVMTIAGITTPNFFKPPVTPGQVSTRYGSIHSKIFLAFGPEERLSKLTFGEQNVSMTLEELTNLHDELHQIRETEIAYDIEELSKGVCAVGVPVWDAAGEVIASVSVIAPTERFGATQKETISTFVKEAGHSLSWKLGYKGHSGFSG